MKRTINLKLTACFMAVLMILTSLSAGFVSACPDVDVYTYNDFHYEIRSDYDDDYNEIRYIAITHYCGSEENIEIPSEINNLPVTEIEYKAFCDNEIIKSVTIPSSVTSIGDMAFENCKNLAQVTLPDTLTYIGQDILSGTAFEKENTEDGLLYAGKYLLGIDTETVPENVTVKEGTAYISAYTFMDCDVKTVSLPSTLKVIGNSAFYLCDELTSVNIPEGVTDISYGAFWGCSTLDEVILPSTLKTIGMHCFADCVSLKSLDVPESVTDLEVGLIAGCKSITEFEIKDTVTYIASGTFSDTGIKSLHIPASVNYIMSLGNCPELAEITVDSNNKRYFEENNVLFEKSFINDSISIIFVANNEALENYVIPDNVKSIDYSALSENKTLKNLTLGKNITDIYDFNAPNLENIYVNPENTTYTSADGVLFKDNGTTLEFYPMGKKDSEYTVPSGVTKLDSGCFKNNPYLTELTIPDTVKELRHTVVESCKNLTTINMGPCEVSYLWPILFCDSLTTINYSGTYTEWDSMEIDVYNGDNKEGLYLYCSDGMVELEAPEYDYEFGDVNLDSNINIRDVTAIQKHLANIQILSEEALFFADFNFDKKVSIQDATDIQKWIAWL